MEFLLSGRTMVLPGIERCSGLRVGDKMVLPRVVCAPGSELWNVYKVGGLWFCRA